MSLRNVGLRLLLVLALALPAPALAQGLIHEIRGGVLAHDVPLWASRRVDGGVAFNGEVAFAPSVKVLGFADLRPVVGGSFTTGNGTSLVYLDIRLEFMIDRFFFGAGVGPAIHNGNLTGTSGKKALGGRVLFHPSFEFGFQFSPQHRVSVYYEHISSAYIARPNPGLDNIGVRLSHRF